MSMQEAKPNQRGSNPETKIYNGISRFTTDVTTPTGGGLAVNGVSARALTIGINGGVIPAQAVMGLKRAIHIGQEHGSLLPGDLTLKLGPTGYTMEFPPVIDVKSKVTFASGGSIAEYEGAVAHDLTVELAGGELTDDQRRRVQRALGVETGVGVTLNKKGLKYPPDTDIKVEIEFDMRDKKTGEGRKITDVPPSRDDYIEPGGTESEIKAPEFGPLSDIDLGVIACVLKAHKGMLDVMLKNGGKQHQLPDFDYLQGIVDSYISSSLVESIEGERLTEEQLALMRMGAFQRARESIRSSDLGMSEGYSTEEYSLLQTLLALSDIRGWRATWNGDIKDGISLLLEELVSDYPQATRDGISIVTPHNGVVRVFGVEPPKRKLDFDIGEEILKEGEDNGMQELADQDVPQQIPVFDVALQPGNSDSLVTIHTGDTNAYPRIHPNSDRWRDGQEPHRPRRFKP